ncbi:MAG: DUF3017 domain-containing protein [Candidatus Nanopelagicales bacterium]|nr:DUF3017 domain-containing protein [Candidatus Nanopelagicales bacterium]
MSSSARSGQASEPTLVDFRRKRVVPKYLPLTLVVAGAAVSLGLLLVDFRLGVVGLAASVLVAFILRMVMSDSDAGLLVVRSSRVDLVILAVLASSLLVLAVIVPAP